MEKMVGIIIDILAGVLSACLTWALFFGPLKGWIRAELHKARKRGTDRIHDIYIVNIREDGTQTSECFNVPEEHGSVKGCYVGKDGKTIYFSDLIRGCRKEG